KVDFSGALTVGGQGAGSMTLDGFGGPGITLTPKSLVVGQSGSGTGALIIQNKATMQVSRPAEIGTGSTGSAKIQSGGTLTSTGALDVGHISGSNGSLTVSVGYVQAPDLDIGGFIGASGTFVDEGAGAKVAVANDAAIGHNGTGTA